MLKSTFTLLLTSVGLTAAAQNSIDTFRLYFDLNVAPLSKNTEKKIDLLIYNDKIINGSSIMVIGYADFLGSEGHNKTLSIKRAENVRNYLVKYGINASDIKTCIGKGEITRKEMTDKEGNETDRRVDIVVNNTIRTETVFQNKTSSNKINNKTDRKNDNSSIAANLNPNTNSKLKKDTGNNSALNKKVDLKELTSLKSGQTILLKNVYFPPGSHIIKTESYATLEKLFKILADNPQIKISIEGHVCCIHDVPDALDIDTNEPLLSLNRAKAIYNYLTGQGIDEARLQYKGYGKQKPIIQFERSEEDADKNRRVEVRIID
ncbi:MAG: OmpA family protein [Taibaiella sp.]|nr:OmpA family protein [Taibaiella sp.]